MNGVIGPLQQWWDGRSRREQRLLALMILLFAAVALWLGVVRPLAAWGEDAAEARARAGSDLVETRAAIVRLAPSEPTRNADLQGLEPTVRGTAEAAGLEITTGMDSSGRLGFRADRAASGAVFGWLADLETTHGLSPVALSVVENADASLQVEGAFRPSPAG